ncbi:MAG: AMP-binding protein [Mycolicibacterium frederiksbergense]|uniref:class I adenylate-forming enzyme family protein n=1 Tax=Mycobacterium adipatum TaxID=1682113 RepID=UPI0027F03E83|nr:AMP-binding protein [Mycolicibacterium frederiksbergense]
MFPNLPDRRAAEAPDSPCVADDTAALTNADFLDAVQRGAATLRRHGIGLGDVVAVMLPNTIDLVVALFAAWRLGAAVTPLNPALSAAEAAFQVTDAGAKVIIAAGPPTFEVPAAALIPADLTSGPASGDVAPCSDADVLALLIYTSGTTGRPKGVMLDHANLNAMCDMVIEAFELTAADHSLLILPLFHVNGIVVSTLSPLLVGGCTTIAGRFDAKTFFSRVESSAATYFSAVPTIYTMLAGLPEDLVPDTSSLRFAVCGAAPASVELLERFERRFGVPIVEGYGLSEGSCASTGNPLHGKRKPGTVGLPLPGQRIRIADPDGHEVPHGQAGEVLIAGPNVMRGYLNRREETAATLVGGWLHTGDIGRLDDDGYLVLVDRAKDMIIRGGENIYPKEIETVAYRLPGVAEAAVVGRANALYGEEPVMFVATSPGSSIDIDQIQRHLADSLSKYKRPVDITFLDELPKNAVGKIDKPSLRRRVASSQQPTKQGK